MAGDVRVGARPAGKPGQLVADDAELVGGAPARVRLARRRQAGERARRARARPGGRRVPRRGRRPPAASPTACSSAAPPHVVGARRGLRRAALAHPPGRARDGDRARATPARWTRDELPYAAGPDRGRRLVHLARRRCCPPCSRPPRRAFDCLALVKPQFEVGRERSARAASSRDPELRRAAARGRRPAAREELGAAVLGFASSGLPGPPATARASCGSPSPAAPGRSTTWRPRRGGRSRERPPRSITIFTHARAGDTATALRRCSSWRAGGRRRGALAAGGGREARHRARPGVELGADPTRRRRPRASCSAATARSSPRCAHFAGTGRAGVRASTTARSASWPRSSPTSLEERLRARASPASST